MNSISSATGYSGYDSIIHSAYGMKNAAYNIQANLKVENAAIDTEQFIFDTFSENGYQQDSIIPENSTISYHV